MISRPDAVWGDDRIHIRDTFVGKIVSRLFSVYVEGVREAAQLTHEAGLQLNIGNHQEALRLASLACAVDAEDETARIVRARALLGCNDFSAAEQEFRTAIDAGANSVEAYVGLSRALSELGRAEEACFAADRALALGNVQPHHYLLLVNVYLRANRLDEAKNIATKCAESWPKNYQAQKALLRVLRNTRQNVEAIDLLHRIRVLVNRPPSASPEILLTRILIEERRLAEAQQYYDLAKSIEPNNQELATLATLIAQHN
jgi:tetratricopeptide (TPR) repeat protein